MIDLTWVEKEQMSERIVIYSKYTENTLLWYQRQQELRKEVSVSFCDLFPLVFIIFYFFTF